MDVFYAVELGLGNQKMKNGCMGKKLWKMSCFIWLIGSIENFFAYVHDTFEFTIFTVYVEKKKWTI